MKQESGNLACCLFFLRLSQGTNAYTHAHMYMHTHVYLYMYILMLIKLENYKR